MLSNRAMGQLEVDIIFLRKMKTKLGSYPQKLKNDYENKYLY